MQWLGIEPRAEPSNEFRASVAFVFAIIPPLLVCYQLDTLLCIEFKCSGVRIIEMKDAMAGNRTQG
jgi:hypothetical protein